MNDRLERELEHAMHNIPDPDPARQALVRREFLAEARRLRTQRPSFTGRRWWLAAAALMITLVGVMFVYQGADNSSQQGVVQTELIGASAQQSGDVIGPENVDQLVELQRFGTGSITGAKWSPDGATIMVYGSLGIGFYDADLEFQRFLETGMAILDAAYSPDGSEIATIHFDGTLRLLNAASGEEMLRIEAHDGPVSVVAFSPDGHMVATGGGQDDPSVRVWSTESGRELMVLHTHKIGVTALQFSPDGSVLASAGPAYSYQSYQPGTRLEDAIVLWDLEQDERLGQLLGHEGNIYAIDFSPDGEYLVSAADDGKVLLWRTYGVHEPLRQLQPSAGPVPNPGLPYYTVDFSDDGRFIAAGRLNGDVELWSSAGDYVDTLHRDAGLTVQPGEVEFSPDGEHLVVVDMLGRVVQLFDVEAGLLVQQLDFSGPYRDIVVSGDMIAATEYTSVRLWNLQSGVLESHYQPSDMIWVNAIDFLPGTNRLAIGVSSTQTSALFLWDQEESVGFGARQLSSVGDVVFSNDGERLFVSDYSTDQVWVYDSSSQELLDVIEFDQHGIRLAVHPNGERIAVGSWERREVWLWDGDGLQEPLRGHSEYVQALAFSSDGRWLVSIDEGSNIIVHDAESGEELGLLDSNISTPHALAFSPDNRLLAVSGFEGFELWDTVLWTPIRTIEGHTTWVTDVVFDETGAFIASSSNDGTVRVWGLE